MQAEYVKIRPFRLRHIPAAPSFLYATRALPDGLSVAIVGSRRMSPYGNRVAVQLGSALAARGVIVVSGLAFGIDAAVHRASLDLGGFTVAVLPSGLDEKVMSPRSHLPLARQIKQQGALVTEYAAATEARKEHFLARNRLISGLADAVVIVEAAERSGSMITARHALEQGRDVWAVPGPIDSPTSEGTNRLISEGAFPLYSIDHFFSCLGIERQETAPPVNDLLRYLNEKPRHIDAVATDVGVPPEELMASLTKYELTGSIRHVGGRYYVRS